MNMITEKYIAYRGKGEHSVNELEKIIEQREEELHVIKSLPTTLPSDEEIYKMMQKRKFVTPDGEIGYQIGMKQMRSLCEAKIAEMEREMKRLEALNKQYSDFRKEVLQIPDELIKEIDDKYFPF